MLLSLLYFRLSQHDNTVRLRSQSRGETSTVLYVDILSARILYVPDDGFDKSRNVFAI
jgi:hypothetical protein